MRFSDHAWRAVLGAVIACVVTASPAARADAGCGGMSAPSVSAPQIDPTEAYQRGLAALQAHDYRRAISAFRDVLRVMPSDMRSNYMLGVAYVGNDDVRAARRPLERATRDSAAPADAWLQ